MDPPIRKKARNASKCYPRATSRLRRDGDSDMSQKGLDGPAFQIPNEWVSSECVPTPLYEVVVPPPVVGFGRLREIVPVHEEALDNIEEGSAFITHVSPPHRS